MKDKFIVIPTLLLAVILVVWFHNVANVNCSGKEIASRQESDTTSGQEFVTQLYEKFIDNKLELYIDEEMNAVFASLSYGEKLAGEDAYTCVNLSELIQKVNAAYLEYDDARMEYVEYALIDSCNDNRLELAVRFGGLMPADDMKLTLIIVEEEGSLFLRHAFEEWSRNTAYMNYFGFVYSEGSSGALSGGYDEYFIGEDGKKLPVYEMEYAYEELTLDHITKEINHSTYVIDGKTYHAMDEEIKETENGEAFCDAYEKNFGKLYTWAEIDELVQKRKIQLGVREEWMQADDPNWQMVENKCYHEFVKYNDLQYERAREQKQEKTLSDSWIICSKTSGYSSVKSSTVLHENWEYALATAVADYRSKQQIKDVTFVITGVESLDDSLYSVTVKDSNLTNREICFIIHHDAVLLELEDYTRYIIAADIREGEMGTYPLYRCSYDTSLTMISYKEQAKVSITQPYAVNGVGLYSFETDAVYAMNHYLLNERADSDMEWNIDINSVSMLAGGNLNMICCSCGEQEIVMLLDTVNEQYAVIKGIDE